MYVFFNNDENLRAHTIILPNPFYPFHPFSPSFPFSPFLLFSPFLPFSPFSPFSPFFPFYLIHCLRNKMKISFFLISK